VTGRRTREAHPETPALRCGGKLDKLVGDRQATRKSIAKKDSRRNKGTLGRLVNDPAIADKPGRADQPDDANGFLPDPLSAQGIYVGAAQRVQRVRRAGARH